MDAMSTAVSGWPRRTFGRLIPPTPLSRRLASRAVLFTLGQGAFNTGSAVFFTQVVGLSPAEVGLGLTIGGITSFVVAYPMGRLADRIGPKRMWALGGLCGGLLFGAWPFIHGLLAYCLLVIGFQVMENAADAGRNAYQLDIMPQEERVQTQAYLYSAINVGYTLGAILGGITLAFNSETAIRYMPWFTMAILVYNAWSIWGMPDAEHDTHAVRGTRVRPAGPGPLANRGWMALSFFDGMMWTNQVLLNIVIPLWLVHSTDSPHWLLAWLFGTNTVLCIFLPTFTSRGVHSVSDAIPRVWIATAFFVLSCLITMVTHTTTGFLTIFLVWLGHVTVTGCELAISSASFAFSALLMDPARRGEYGGVQELFRALGSRWAPAVFTLLAMQWHPNGLPSAGWLVIAAFPVIAALGIGPAARSAERFLEQNAAASAEPVTAVAPA